jgi:choline dehydrogenase-like flavoprotein
MHIDAQILDTSDIVSGDICIVGAGAAGISIALDWTNKGYKVLLLEGGGFKYDEKIQELYAGKQTGQKYYPLKSARLHYFGGTTNHWSGMCARMDPIDFKERDWVPESGWPIKFEDLEPYYVKAHELVEIGPYNYDLDYWKSTDNELKELPLDRKSVFHRIYHFSPPTRFGEKYRDQILSSHNIYLYTHANVIDIKTDENASTVQYVVAKNHAGKTIKFSAKYYILACCAIQNSRLLLSSDSVAKNGLGNDRDLVGRYWMEHPELKTGELWINHPDRLKLYVYNDGYDAKVRAEIGLTEEKQVEQKILNCSLSLSPLDIAQNMKPIIETWSKDDPRESYKSTEKSNIRAVRKKWLHMFDSHKQQSFELFTRLEQAPNASSRITLDTERDSLGMRRSNLHWALSDLDKETIRATHLFIANQFGISGIGRIKVLEFLDEKGDYSWPSSTGGGWHHMGTTRMHDLPEKGVVDKNCQVHGISNLFVAGSSCFTTGGAVNPTLTLIALSLRLSDHIAGRLQLG